ncbi:Putative dioxygenase family protein [Candidatus Deianiraea vastatrix]|uniref:Dioxygenase family protein n=2 Tax=Candidatus Deianiraea vastatrix TaxID=2163644 RepID=A0A5B8XFD6_9RICK|nr:Putative dioxygenase family protein [Candidatus Deianiraea vastatrix]
MPVISYKISILAILLLYAPISYAKHSPEIILYNRRFITPSIPDDQDAPTKPQEFYKTNNLRRKTGSPFLAKGEYLFIEGYVTDLLNNPIENARIYIWQTNIFGYYNHLLKNTEDDTKYDIDFPGSGTFVTDNLGHYEFTTIAPGYYGTRAPHIHFLIKHDLFYEDFETQMFLPGHPRNLQDEIFTSISPLSRTLVSPKITLINKNNPGDGKYALFNIRIDWIHPNKS